MSNERSNTMRRTLALLVLAAGAQMLVIPSGPAVGQETVPFTMRGNLNMQNLHSALQKFRVRCGLCNAPDGCGAGGNTITTQGEKEFPTTGASSLVIPFEIVLAVPSDRARQVRSFYCDFFAYDTTGASSAVSYGSPSDFYRAQAGTPLNTVLRQNFTPQ